MVTSDAAKYTYDFADATNELATAMTNMNESMMIALSGSKSWTVVSRLTSGSGFWKIQNKIRAITDVFKVYDNVQKKAIENSDKFGKQMKSMATIMNKVPKNMNFDALRAISQGEMIDTSPTKKYEEVLQSETFQAIKTLFGNEKALSYAEEQIVEQTKMIEQIRERLQWQEAFAKGDIKTRATMIREKIFRLAAVYLGLFTTLGKYLLMTALPYILGGIALLVVAVPLVAIAIGVVLDVLRFINDSVNRGASQFEGSIASGMKLIDLLLIPLNYIFEIMKQVGLIVKLALTGKLIQALGETLRLVFYTILFKGVEMIIEWGTTLFGVTVNFIVGAIIGIGDRIIQLIDYINPFKLFDKMGSGAMFGMASGGISNGGMTMVGESGPEMVYLPNGSRVMSSPNTRRGAGATVNVYVNGRVGASDAEINDIAQKVGRAINIQMNRSTNSGVSF